MTKLSLSAGFSQTADLLTFQIIWGSQDGPRLFDFFLEVGRNTLLFLPMLTPVEQDLYFNFINE